LLSEECERGGERRQTIALLKGIEDAEKWQYCTMQVLWNAGGTRTPRRHRWRTVADVPGAHPGQPVAAESWLKEEERSARAVDGLAATANMSGCVKRPTRPAAADAEAVTQLQPS
jgi:hypothetical protein